MIRLQLRMGQLIQKVMDRVMGNGLMQEETTASGERYQTPGIGEIARKAAAESCVLLKNNGILPLDTKQPVVVFGRCQLDWFFVGYGSGGDVNAPYTVNLMEGLKNGGVATDEVLAASYRSWCASKEHQADHGWWGHWPMSHPEMAVDEETVREAATRATTAIVVIGRAAGEDRENRLEPGSYYLTEDEKALLSRVTGAFSHTVVLLNSGSIIDMSWLEAYGKGIDAALIVWQGGMESGNAVCDVLTGKINPCGKLADTIALSYADYPSAKNFGGKQYNCYQEDIYVGDRYFSTFAKDRVRYPFGFGLSYTTFHIGDITLTRENGQSTASATVKNTGAVSGREVLQLWCEAPQGALGKPARALAAFGKTRCLMPNESETVTLTFADDAIASYDDAGKTEYKNAFVLEAGEYRFCVNTVDAGSFTLEKTVLVRQCEPICQVQHPFLRRLRDGSEKTPKGDVDLKGRILERLPKEIPVTAANGLTLSDVAEGKATLEAFVAQLSDQELEALTRGEGAMNSKLGIPGNAGAFGGVLPSLREKGVPPIVTADGPAGLRLQTYCSLLPCATALACTWDTALIETLFTHIGKEMQHYGVDVILSPALNIHRDPLCGRNFEYYAEDPLLAGKMAAATVRGVQSVGGSCCPKHFACNNQEYNRNNNDSRVSERALREIYLRGFEICVRESSPNTLMTSYNKINGVWAHYNYDLATTVLRGEWGFTGVVVTDWWMRRSRSPEFSKLYDNAYRVRAQVDVLMPGDMGRVSHGYHSDGSLLPSLGKDGGITRAELQRTACTVLRLILKTKYAAKQ